MQKQTNKTRMHVKMKFYCLCYSKYDPIKNNNKLMASKNNVRKVCISYKSRGTTCGELQG